LVALLNLYVHLHRDEDPLTPDVAAATWDAILASPVQRVFVLALPNGEIVASCVLAIALNLTRGGRPFGVIENVVTHADHRKQGYGTAVLQAAKQAAIEAGCYRLSLDTGSKRETTLRFYEAAGFDRGTKTHFEIKFP